MPRVLPGERHGVHVMEFEDGLPLSELLRQREADGRPLDEKELLAIAIPPLEGLSRVPESGGLHRDVKPSNIIVRREDSSPVLLDFGAARQEVAIHSKSLAPFTEGYAAIEQVGEGDLGPWTDLYAVGCCALAHRGGRESALDTAQSCQGREPRERGGPGRGRSA